uniref:Uncharacterized protein n=1 Tax=Anguilla anguilla TaxID=7936 RepID=A0A0E9PK16_ANGAN
MQNVYILRVYQNPKTLSWHRRRRELTFPVPGRRQQSGCCLLTRQCP